MHPERFSCQEILDNFFDFEVINPKAHASDAFKASDA